MTNRLGSEPPPDYVEPVEAEGDAFWAALAAVPVIARLFQKMAVAL